MTQRTAGRDHDRAQDSAYKTEHMLAWALAALAILFTLLGLLVGFGVLGDTPAGGSTPGDVRGNEFLGLWDAAVWLLPAIAAALLSFALHRNEHHRHRDPDRLPDDEEGLWKAEHSAAWLMTAASIVLGALCLLVGFDIIGGDYDQPDGILWGLGSVVTAILANALHSVRHHQMVRDFVLQRDTRTVGAGERERGSVRPRS